MTATGYRSAADIQEQLDAAVQAVRQLYDSTATTDHFARERAARREVWHAHRLDGTTPAQIAAAVGVRQLLVARLLDDGDARAEALVTARHDAERYQRQVMDAIRGDVRRRWDEATGGGTEDPPRGWLAATCATYRISRPTLDAWIAEWSTPALDTTEAGPPT